MALDPSGYMMEARILTADGRTVNLWMRSGLDTPGLQDLAIVKSVEIDLSLGLTGSLTVRCVTGFEQGIALIDDDVLAIGNYIEARLGYPRTGRFTPWFYGIMRKPEIQYDDEFLSITMGGVGGGFASMRSSSSRIWQSKTPRQIVQELADRHGWRLEGPAVDAGNALDRQRQTVGQNNLTDWVFLQQLVRGCGCDVHLTADMNGATGMSLVLLRRDQWLTAQPTPGHVFRFKEQVDYEGSFPVLGFASKADVNFMPRGGSGVRTADVNPDTGDLEMSHADAGTTSTAQLGERTLARQGDTGGPRRAGPTGQEAQTNMVTPGMTQQTPEVGVHVSISARSGSTEDRASQAQSVADEHGMQGGIALELEAFGLPEMFPAEVIEVSGLGRKLSGLYGVTHVKHKADGDGWLMTMDVLRNAFSLNEVQAARVEGRVNVGGDSSQTSGSDVSGTTAGANDVVVQPVVGE